MPQTRPSSYHKREMGTRNGNSRTWYYADWHIHVPSQCVFEQIRCINTVLDFLISNKLDQQAFTTLDHSIQPQIRTLHRENHHEGLPSLRRSTCRSCQCRGRQVLLRFQRYAVKMLHCLRWQRKWWCEKSNFLALRLQSLTIDSSVFTRILQTLLGLRSSTAAPPVIPITVKSFEGLFSGLWFHLGDDMLCCPLLLFSGPAHQDGHN